jgi:DNA-binding transcriptional LysR family regulator
LTLVTEKLVGLIPPEGAWTSPVPSRLREYLDLPFVGLDRNDFSEYWRFLDRICETRGIRLQPSLQVKSKHSLMMLVAGGMGVSVMPAHVAESVPGTLRIVPISDLTEEIPIVAAFQRHSQNSMLPAFLQVLKDCLELQTASPSAQ